MKKSIISLFVCLLALCACRQDALDPGQDSGRDLSGIRYDLTINHPQATKGIKSAWQDGDRVFIFFNNITSVYLTADFNNSNWSVTYHDSSAGIGENGKLTAVFLPYGKDATVTFFEGKWTFSGQTDSYYLYASDVDYSVETINDTPTLISTINMSRPDGFVQFYIPDDDASGTVSMACNTLLPRSLASVSAEGALAVSDGTAGSWITGYPDTIEGDAGYYVSGKPASDPGTEYYFALKKDGTYVNYYKQRDAAIASPHAYKLPSYSAWPVMKKNDSDHFVFFANSRWRTMNLGISESGHPWELGTLYPSSEVLPETEELPSDENWVGLLDEANARWIPMRILDSDGALIVSPAGSKYIFLPRNASAPTDYWSSGMTDSYRHYVQIASDRTKPSEVSTSGSPANGYIRSVKKVALTKNWFRFNVLEDGTITRQGSTTLQYSTDYGVSWSEYSSAITVTAGDVVCFRSTAKNWTSNSSGKKLVSSGRFEVAGDITSLLTGDQFETAAATIPTDYNFQDFFKECTTLVDASELVLSMTAIPKNGLRSFFDGCTSLVAGPKELPATTIGATCYRNMFKDCTNLTSAPIIRNPTTKHNDTGWYQQMFLNCSSLQKIVFLDASTYSSGNFTDWVKGIASSGTFVKNASASMTEWTTGTSGIPSNWTIENYSE